MFKLISALTILVVCAACSLSITFSCEDKEKFSLSSTEDLIINDDVYATVDPAKPVIKGIDITVGNLVCLTQNQLKSQFNYSDDNTPVASIRFEIRSDAYTPSYNIPGKYKVTGKIWDVDNNSASTSFYVTVIDVDYPVLSFDNAFKIEKRNDEKIPFIGSRMALTFSTYDVSIREYKSDNFLVNGVLKAFWELWDLFYEELFGGSK